MFAGAAKEVLGRRQCIAMVNKKTSTFIRDVILQVQQIVKRRIAQPAVTFLI